MIALLIFLSILSTVIIIIQTAVQSQQKQRKYQKQFNKQNNLQETKKIESSPFLMWLIEFSKKVVILCVILYTVVIIYSTIAMWISKDLSALSTLISESSEVLRACVFGYMIKAGIENWQKIKKFSNTQQENNNKWEE